MTSRIPVPQSVTLFAITDYLFWLMMLFANVPLILELWGIDTIYKPYRMLSLALSALAIPAILREPEITRRFSRPLLFALAYLFVVTVVFAGGAVVEQLPFLITCLALFFASYGVTSRKSLTIGLGAYALSFLVSSYFGLLAFNRGQYRFSGLFENPNAFGYGGCFVFLIVINRYVPIPRLLKLIFALTVAPILLLTGSRGTVLTMLGVFVSQTWRNPRLFYGLVAAGILVLAINEIWGDQIVAQFKDRSIFDRYSQEVVERGAVGRFAQIRAGMQVASEHAFIGIGLGQYREKHHTRFFHRRGLNGQIVKLELHNVFVSLLCEWGLFGLLAFATIIVRMLNATKEFEYERDWVYGFIGASFLNGLGNNLLGEIPFWIMLGVTVQMIRFACLERQFSGQFNRHSRSVYRQP